MKREIEQSIQVLLQSDPTVSPEHRKHVLKACRTGPEPKKRRRVGTVKQAATILCVHPKTVHRWIRRGLIEPIHYTQRSVRVDLDEVEKLAACGVDVFEK